MSVSRLLASLLLLIPIVTSAQTDSRGAAIQPSPAPLTDAQWGRLLDRLDGRWRLNLEKSIYYLSPAPQNVSEHIYVKDETRRGIAYISGGRESFQVLDGTPSTMQPAPQQSTVARWPIDEFTVENVTTSEGKPRSILMQFLSPDGMTKIIVGRSIDEHGGQTPTSVRYWDKIPDDS